MIELIELSDGGSLDFFVIGEINPFDKNDVPGGIMIKISDYSELWFYLE